MAKEIAFENGRISNFKGLVTLDRVILHTIVHHSSTTTYILHFIEIKKKLSVDGRTYARTYVRTYRHLRLALLGDSVEEST